MSEKQKENINRALRMLSALSVSGDVVDLMAAVKSLLRETLEEEQTDG